jgi:hypothetical protein
MEKNFSIEGNDFMVRIRPLTNSSGSWTGEIDLAVITSPDNELGDDDYVGMMHFCKMVASSIPVMELNEEFRELVHSYVIEVVDKDYEDDVEEKATVINTEGNIVTVDFKTKGNA